MNDRGAQWTRRTTFGFLFALGLGSGLAPDQAGARVRTGHRRETRAVGFTRLVYTDDAGNELAQMRPYAMQDLSHRPEVETPAGTRTLGLSVTIWNTGDADLMAPPSAFALWGVDGRLYRTEDISAASAPHDRVEMLRASEHSAVPIPPCGERFGWLHYRVPAEARLAGLLFTPEPERILVVADFSIPSTSIID